jgi:hypothetical protein
VVYNPPPLGVNTIEVLPYHFRRYDMVLVWLLKLCFRDRWASRPGGRDAIGNCRESRLPYLIDCGLDMPAGEAGWQG